MSSRLLVASIVATTVLSGAFASAADKPATANVDPPVFPLKDKDNKTGISPYMEAINKGEASFIARDFSGAVVAFQDAIKMDNQQMLAFYRLGEAQLAAGKPEEADAIWTAGLSKEGSLTLKGKLLFVLADLKERQKKLDAAKDAWGKYAQFLKDNAQEAKGYALTPEERIKMIERRMKDEKDYPAVKERIAKREAERIKEAEENAKRDKANK